MFWEFDLFLSAAGAAGVFIAVYTLAGAAPLPHLRVRRLLEQRRRRPAALKKRAAAERAASVAALAGGLAGLAVMWGQYALAGFAAGAAAGFVLARLRRGLARRLQRIARLREVSLLYEGADMYIQAGYTVHAALAAAAALTPGIRRAVERCLRSWGQGPLKALQAMGEEIGLAEAQVLVAVLQQAVQSGPERLKGVMAEEAAKLEKLRQFAAEQEIASKPLYQTVYLALPGFALFGTVMFPLGHQVIQLLHGLNLAGL